MVCFDGKNQKKKNKKVILIYKLYINNYYILIKLINSHILYIYIARQLSKSEVCIATSMSVKTRNSCPASPALSMPRSRDVFQDMEALKISRHDNPYLQVGKNNFYDVKYNFIFEI